jgi:hypothetical protein
MRKAIDSNWNLERLGLNQLPKPYQVYGSGPGEPAIPWQAECDRLRASYPQLQRYPRFAEMNRLVGAFIDGLTTTPPGATWSPERGWVQGSSAAGLDAVAKAAKSFPQSIRQRLQQGLPAPSGNQGPASSRPSPPRKDTDLGR